MGKTVRAHGSKPLVILATSRFDLNGTIDLSSSVSGKTGAGAQAVCSQAVSPTVSSGGFGGSFAGQGGFGAADGGGTLGQPAPKVQFPHTLMGGCPGGAGAKSSSADGTGGAGGGAVAIISPIISLGGKINTSGAAGSGGPGDPMQDSGGGGGGAGGMIVIDAPSIVPVSGSDIWLFANGGGGGQGGTHGAGAGTGAGDNGQEAVDPFTAINGGSGNRNGGLGGNGAFGVHTDGTDGAQGTEGSAGGGGGGGGAGFVYAPTISGAEIGGVQITP